MQHWERMSATAAIIALSASASVVAAPLAFDSFEQYDAAALEDENGAGANGGTGAWNGPWNVDAGLEDWATVVNHTMTYAAGDISVHGGNNALQFTPDSATAMVPLLRPFNATGSAPLYLSFLIQAPTIATTGDTKDDFLQIGFETAGDGMLGGTGNTRASVGISGDDPNFFARSTTSSKDADNQRAADTVNPNQTYLVVLRLDKINSSTNYNQVRAYINPTSLTESNPGNPSLLVTEDSGLPTVGNLGFRTARMNPGDTFYLDHFTLGNSFATVVPEPASICLLTAAAATLLRRRRQSA